MKKLIITACLLVFISGVRAQDKSAFDIQSGSSLKNTSIKKVSGYDSQRLTGPIYDATLISGGYFTLGTTAGISESSLDDNCTLTFGHPYALTSYPVISVDGTWYKPEDYFGGISSLIPEKSGDTLMIYAVKTGIVSYTFKIVSQTETRSIKISASATNLDSKPHSFGLGLLIDPALGKGGDAYFEIPTGKMFTGSEIPSNILLWEKGTGAKGVAMNIGFPPLKPEKIIAANWADLYQTQAPVFETDYEKAIYDLYMKFYWPESTVSPGSSISSETSISLPQPDFSSQVFLRWDLPNFISMNGGLMFPQSLESYVEINPAGGSEISSGTLNINVSSPLTAATTEFGLPLINTNPAYIKTQISSKITYEDKVVKVTAQVMSGTKILDEISRNVFVPQTPVSDTGLVVAVDTVISSGYPDIAFTFHAKVKATDRLIGGINADNVFLYENSERINDFQIMRDTTGGVTAADIVFVLDVTGSMSSIIDAVKNNIVEFADSLEQRGIDYRLGMVTFLDVVENTYAFTGDVQTFKSYVAAQYAHGGGDGPENSLQGLLDGTKMSFRNNAK